MQLRFSGEMEDIVSEREVIGMCAVLALPVRNTQLIIILQVIPA